MGNYTQVEKKYKVIMSTNDFTESTLDYMTINRKEILVLKYPHIMSPHQVERIFNSVISALGEDTPVMAIPDNVELAIWEIQDKEDL